MTTICVWVHLVGFQPAGATLWQAKQLVAATGTWLPGLPLAETPWQLAQLVAALKLAWLTCAPAQPLVVWQLSQLVTPVWTGVLGLPTALR